MSTEAPSTPLITNSAVALVRPIKPVAISEGPVKPDVKIDTRIVETDEPPIDIYEGRKGRPYIADVLDIGDLFGKTEMEGSLKDIDQYVLAEIELRKFAKTKESYETIVKEFSNKLQIDPNLSWEEKIKKLKVYVDVLNRQKELEHRRRIIEHAIPQ